MSDNFSLGFGGDYSYNKGDFDIKGNWGSSAKGHSDNIGIFQILDIKHLITLFYLLTLEEIVISIVKKI